jgi:hypothetical protein
MNEEQNIEETLWNYIDGTMTAEVRSFVENLVRTNSEWRAKHAELVEVHQLMQSHIQLEEPSMRFTQNVMEEISRLYITPAAQTYINKNIIWGIAIFFITTIVGLLGYGFGQIDWTQPGSGSTLEYNISSVDWSKLFNSTYMNIFIMVNIVLGLMLLDMYLSKKKKKIQVTT